MASPAKDSKTDTSTAGIEPVVSQEGQIMKTPEGLTGTDLEAALALQNYGMLPMTGLGVRLY
jgi:hypothetical protein